MNTYVCIVVGVRLGKELLELVGLMYIRRSKLKGSLW